MKLYIMHHTHEPKTQDVRLGNTHDYVDDTIGVDIFPAKTLALEPRYVLQLSPEDALFLIERLSASLLVLNRRAKQRT